MIALSKRLQAVAALAGEGVRVIDIGTDHGYIPLYLIENGRMREGLACDVRPGPLARATEHIALYGYTEQITTRLSDGLDRISVEEATGAVIVMAGMGGALIRRLVSAKAEVAAAAKRLVLQPQSEWPQFRRWLLDSGFAIEQEHLLEEDGKWYLCFAGQSGTTAFATVKDRQLFQDAETVKDGAIRQTADAVSKHYGDYLFTHQPAQLLRFLQKEAKGLAAILQQLPLDAGQRRDEVTALLAVNRLAQERLTVQDNRR
ncbi:MAG: class I SAM-dependent methyltransferase [Eubacteriales bacterium]|nr:class I SAM-dependent methyltransferase [Eubacteriales bacterium]